MSIEFYLDLLRKVYAIEEVRIPNYSKGKFYSRILELSGTHPDNDHFMVPDMLKVMLGINHGDLTHLLKDEIGYMKTNMILQFAFIAKRVDSTTKGRVKVYNWEYYQERYIDGLEVKVTTAAEMRMLVHALVVFWKEQTPLVNMIGSFVPSVDVSLPWEST